ncbi:MAG: adenylyl-sulfate kinase, partial [Candidatus Bathyarchaeia archaeon]
RDAANEPLRPLTQQFWQTSHFEGYCTSLNYFLNKVEPMAKEGWCVWITGLPGSGKSIVSKALLKQLEKEGILAQLLSSDALRKVMTPHATCSLEERDAVYDTLVYIASLLTSNGVNVVIDATGNLRRYRENARKQIPRFIEAYLKCPLEVCIKREASRKKTFHAPRGIYSKAKENKATTVPGIGQPYEPSPKPELTIDAWKQPPAECARKIFQKILEIQSH